MTNSMRIIAALMDPGVNTDNQKPAFSLRNLVAQHRWQNNKLPSPLSLRSIVARHQSTNPSARFLSYNTYLLDGFVINFGLLDIISLVNKLKWSLPRLLTDLGVTSWFVLVNWPDWVIALIVDTGFTVKAFATIVNVVDKIQGYINDCLNASTFGLWGEITDWAEVTFDMVIESAGNNVIVQWLDDNGLGPADILAAAHIDLWALVDLMGYTHLRVLQIILKQFGVDLPDERHIKPKEEVEQRGIEIGLTLQRAMDVTGGYTQQPIEKSYQIMALCEVWRQVSQDRIANNLGHTGYSYVSGSGVANGKLNGSGLLQIIQLFKVIENETVSHVYSTCGDEYGDSDYWASKGVLLTRIRIKDGNPPWEIDLFSTHLHWGGELLGEFIENMEPTWEARVQVRQAQIRELVTFIRLHHNPRNVAILTGDFNISANDTRTFPFLENCNEYVNLVQQLQTLNLYDQWTDWPYVDWNVAKAKPDWKCSSGRTDGKDWDNYKDYAGPIYIRDPVKDSSEAECPRYDHIFIERPTTEHSFMLDISRIQRRHFKRDGQNHEIAMLSDHLGLDAMLFFSPNT
jgi:hypothetical protein